MKQRRIRSYRQSVFFLEEEAFLRGVNLEGVRVIVFNIGGGVIGSCFEDGSDGADEDCLSILPDLC